MGLNALGNKKDIPGMRYLLILLLVVAILMTSGIITYINLYLKYGMDNYYVPLFTLVVPFIICVVLAWIILKKLINYSKLPSVAVAYDEENKSIQVMASDDLYEIELNELVDIKIKKNSLIFETKDNEFIKSIPLDEVEEILKSIKNIER